MHIFKWRCTFAVLACHFCLGEARRLAYTRDNVGRANRGHKLAASTASSKDSANKAAPSRPTLLPAGLAKQGKALANTASSSLAKTPANNHQQLSAKLGILPGKHCSTQGNFSHMGCALGCSCPMGKHCYEKMYVTGEESLNIGVCQISAASVGLLAFAVVSCLVLGVCVVAFCFKGKGNALNSGPAIQSSTSAASSTAGTLSPSALATTPKQAQSSNPSSPHVVNLAAADDTDSDQEPADDVPTLPIAYAQTEPAPRSAADDTAAILAGRQTQGLWSF